MEISKLFNVEGKVVLVTGGARGIGLYITQGFVANGAKVYVTSRSADVCQKVAEELTKKGPGKCIALPGEDLSTQAATLSVAKELGKLESKLHVLVNNSGASWGEPFEEYSEKGFDKVMDLNLKGVFFLIQSLFPLLLAASEGPENPARVINVGSSSGVVPQPFPTYAYDASKAALHHLTRKLGAELGPKGVTVNCIAPGYVPSKMSKGLLTYHEESALVDLRPGKPTDMAGVALFLASDAGSWLNGSIISADGGMVLRASKF